MASPTTGTNQRVTVSLPDLFKSFLVVKPELDSNYESVKDESEKWLQSTMGLSAKQSKRVNYCDFTYTVSVIVPNAPRERLRIFADWGNWVFVFDDMFDEGELTDDPVASRRVIDNLLSAMVPGSERTSEEPAVTAHDSIFQRFAAASPPSVVKRYIEAMVSYCAGVVQHVDDYAADRIPEISEMLDTRRKSAGVSPMFPLVEFAYGLRLPDEIFHHPTIQTLETLAVELVVLMNDILSYQKEESDNIPFNMVAAARMMGASPQEAFDQIAALVDARFGKWEQSMHSLPSWGQHIDGQVLQYIQGVQNIVQATLSWRRVTAIPARGSPPTNSRCSFRSGRYFGPRAEHVRETREIDVLMEPSFLSVHKRTSG